MSRGPRRRPGRSAAAALVLVALAAGACRSGGAGDAQPSGPDEEPGVAAREGTGAESDSGRSSGSSGSSGKAGAADRQAKEAGFAVLAASVPKTARRGETVKADFQSRPGNSCQGQVHYASTPPGADGQPLEPKLSDPSSGLVSWTWQVGPDVAAGTARALIVCSGGQRGEASIRIL